MRSALALVVAAAGPVSAQDIAFSPEATESCLAAAEHVTGKEACVGRAADACIETPDGGTTVGMGFCLDAEWRYWDERLNAAYGALMAMEKTADKEVQSGGSSAPSTSMALKAMQRAWISYRDAACLYEVSTWFGGTGGGPAGNACMMTLTGQQALALEDRLRTRSGP